MPFLHAQSVQDEAYDAMLNELLSREVPEIGVEGARAKADAVFLDAREREEFEVSHIPDAVWVGFKDFREERLEGVPKDRPVVVYCSVGYRSERITERLLKAGFTEVYNLYGGIFEWVNRNYPVQDAKGDTSKIHAYNYFWGVWLTAGRKVY